MKHRQVDGRDHQEVLASGLAVGLQDADRHAEQIGKRVAGRPSAISHESRGAARDPPIQNSAP